MNVQNNGTFVSDSYIAYIKPSDKSFNLESIPSSQTKFSFMNNLYVSEGRKGKVCSSLHFSFKFYFIKIIKLSVIR